jgi:hypothetical protein
MKQKRKHILKKLLIFGIAVLLASCSEDLYDEQINKNNSKYTVTNKTFEELLKDKRFMKTYSELNISDNSTSKTVMEQNYNFTITDVPAKVIEYSGKISYTFHIVRDTVNTDYFENLIVGSDSLNQTTAYIAKYKKDFTKPSLDNKVPFTKFSCNSIIYNNNQTARVVACVEIVYPACTDTGEKYCAGRVCGFNSVFVCSGSSGSSGSGELGGSGTSWQGGGTGTIPHDGGGGGTPNPDATDPCTTLTKAKNDSKVQTAIDDLKTKTTDEKEFAYEIERRRSLLTDSGYEYNTKFKTGTNFGVIVTTGNYVQGQAHNHPINGVAIPSFDDIFWTQLCEEEISVTNDGTAFNTIVSPDPANPGGTILYSITIDNIEALQAATAAVFNLPEILAETDEKIKRKKIMEKFEKIFVPLKSNTDAQEKTFLQTFATYGITLTKFNDATQKWEKLKLDPTNPNNVTKEPCN